MNGSSGKWHDPNVKEWENQWYGSGGAAGVMLSTVVEPSLKQYEGMNFEQIGAAMKKDPRDAVMDIVIADRGRSDVITSIMDEADVRTALANPLVAIGTDSGARAEDGPLSGSKSHPRGWGSFPRILGRYVRDEHLLTLEEAIRRFTSRPAWRVGMTDRGIIRPGMKADITIFNPDTVRDVATFENPGHYAEGVTYVLVNGQAVVDSGRITEARPGQVIRGPGYTGEMTHCLLPSACARGADCHSALARCARRPRNLDDSRSRPLKPVPRRRRSSAASCISTTSSTTKPSSRSATHRPVRPVLRWRTGVRRSPTRSRSGTTST